ncbi:baseplate J/gp47 family protein [Gilliamella sp. B2969]|uniref:baseplate assembly protein n=1 Tax=Gilliamella sp. B2969 TaxID=2818021 RepID=UPI00226A669F|nr:baseplate J/gp47 family protein [Gilliamella sp. B2969]MCX8731166.1 baseplate J/gp47 family protein [Gilliamella sp. B2969]
MTSYNELMRLDDVNFTDTDAKKIEQQIIDDYQRIAKTVLYPGDPIRLFLTTLAYRISHERSIYNIAAQQTLLRYATGLHLDHIGAMLATFRRPESFSACIVEFSINQPLEFDVVVPAGTRVTSDGTAIFETLSEIKIPAGELSASVNVQCQFAGKQFNNIEIGQIDKFVDPIAYITSVKNITKTTGGADVENDTAYRERISLAPEKFSVAGPKLAYRYHALSAHQNIIDVAVERTIPGVVRVSILLTGGKIPDVNATEITAVKKILNDDEFRPLTDTVDVVPAVAVNQNYSIKWFLSESNIYQQSIITQNIERAVAEYEFWQSTKLGRDINPDELIHRCKQAGAKRIEITGMNYRVLANSEVCLFVKDDNRITFAGTESE